MAWASWGRGPAVILANGIACTDTYWTYLVPFLVDAGYRVIFFDNRGHGRSGPPANPNEVLVTAHARDLWEVANAAGLDQAVIVGHSMGVETALEAYRLAPERVAGLTAIAGGFQHPFNSLYSTAAGRWLLAMAELLAEPSPWAARLLWSVVGKSTWLPTQIGKAMFMIGRDAPDQLMDEYFDHTARLDPVLLLRFMRGLQLHTAKDLLPNVAVPVLIVAGERDVLTPPRLAREMASLLPDVRLAIIAEGSHTLPIDVPDELHSLLADFLAEVWGEMPKAKANGKANGKAQSAKPGTNTNGGRVQRQTPAV